MLKPVYDDGAIQQYCGDCIEVMPQLPGNSVDAMITDPPYGLEFMGKEWDKLEAKGHWDGSRGWQGDTKDVYGRYQGTAPAAYKAGIDAQRFHQRWATQALRVLKPGGHALVFGGARTHHRLYCGMEDAGFELRETIAWIFGSGFPKNLDISKEFDRQACREQLEKALGRKPTRTEFKQAWAAFREVVGQKVRGDVGKAKQSGATYARAEANRNNESIFGYGVENLTIPATPEAKEWQGWGTALKPAFEPILLCRKPISEKNVALNVLKWGTGGLAIDNCRISLQGEAQPKGSAKRVFKANQYTDEKIYGDNTTTSPLGRWPANVILECICDELEEIDVMPSGSVSGNEPSRPVKNVYGEYNRKTFTAHEGKMLRHTNPDCPCYMLDQQSGESISSGGHGEASMGALGKNVYGQYALDRQGANAGGLGDKGGASRFFYCAKASTKERGKGNLHATVKPIALCEYLIKLVSKPGQVILDPFAGSMTIPLAAIGTGRKCIAIEKSEEYCQFWRNRHKQIEIPFEE